jgi:hypothetical protein
MTSKMNGDYSKQQGSKENDEVETCLSFIENMLSKFTPGSEEEEEFREQTMMDLFRNAGAPLTLVKELRNRYTGGPIEEYTQDLSEIVGLMMFSLKDEPCIPRELNTIREKIISIADDAFKELDEKKRTDSSIPTVKEEDDPASTTNTPSLSNKKRRATSASSSQYSAGSSLASSTDDFVDDDDDMEEAEEEGEDDDGSSKSSSSSSSSSSSTTKSRKEMNRLIEAKQYVSVEKIANVLVALEQESKTARKLCDRFLGLLHTISAGSEDDCYVLSEIFAPMLARPQDTAYMSIRHNRELPKIRLVLWVWLESHEEILSLTREPYSISSAKSSASATPPPASRHLFVHSIKPRLSSVSSGAGIGPFSPPQVPFHPSQGEGPSEFPRLSPSQHRPGHVRRKTPPRISDLMQKRKIDFEHLESFISSAVELLFALDDIAMSNRTENWLAEECGLPPAIAIPTAQQLPVGSSAIVANVANGQNMTGQVKRQWATKERVTIEKRVLKKRLLHWDKDFEQKFNRKPTREDRVEVRGVFQAYGALKTLLNALESSQQQTQNPSPSVPVDNLLVLEKRALQAVLKLFEKDFEDRMGRKVEVAADIAGRELEYSRYKELKEMIKSS